MKDTLLEEFQDYRYKGLKPDKISYTILISSFENDAQVQGALVFLKEAESLVFLFYFYLIVMKKKN